MPRTYAKQVKKVKLKMFLFFLFVAFFIWFLTKFSKEFTATVEASIHYENLPSNTIIASNNMDRVSFDLTTNGFDFLFYKLKKPKLSIDVKNYFYKEDHKIKIPNSELIKIITSKFKNDIAVKNVSIEEMVIILDSIVSKKIPVFINSNITFQNGFKAIRGIQLMPDSIMVSGPSLKIDSINNIKTKIIELQNVSKTISEEIEIDISNNTDILLTQKKVLFTITVEEFTQKKLTLPIRIKNLPNEINIKLIPEVITIIFDVSLKEFNSISDKDFTIVCDFEKRNNKENFMIPEILKKPEIIMNIEFQEKKIDYLIFK